MRDALKSIFASLKKPAVILDLGCGAGQVATYAGELGFQAIAVDRHIASPPTTRSKRVIWIEKPVEDWIKTPYLPKIDVVVIENVLQYLDGSFVKNELLPTLSRHLYEGGHILIETFLRPPDPPINLCSTYGMADLQRALPTLSPIFMAETEGDYPAGGGRVRRFYLTQFIARKPNVSPL